MLTLRDLLSDLDVRLASGGAELDAPVRWVHISELEDPTPFLSGGELLLTTGMALEDADTQRAYVARLAAHGLAGLGLGTGFAHASMPEALVEAAAEHGFALFEVPYELPFIALTEKAFTHLVNEQYAVLRRALTAHERLERIVLSEQGLEGVAAALSTLIGGPALIFDGRGEELASSGAEPRVVAELGAELRERARAGARREFAPGGRARGARAGAARRAHGRPRRRRAAGVAGGRQGRRRAVGVRPADAAPGRDDRRARAAAPPDGRRHRAAAGGRRAERAGLRRAGRRRPRAPPGAVRARRPGRDARAGPAAPGQGRGRGRARRARSATRPPPGWWPAPAASRARCSRRPRAATRTCSRSPSACALRVTRDAGAELAAGAGRAALAGDARRTFHEARCALEARELAGNGGPGPVATFHDLGSFQLLLSLQDDEALRLFCDSILAPIQEGEGAYGGELMRSLEAFIECNGQWERASRQLYCHRHTLRYRIRRVEELTGRSLDSARDRIDFWLALRGRELIGH